MTLVLVERTFPEPQIFEDLQAIEDGKSWCLEMHQVRFLGTYFSVDGRRMLCQYEAPDTEAVRRAQGAAGLPYWQAWAPDSLQGEAQEPTAPDAQVVVVERTFPRTVSIAEITVLTRTKQWCLDMHRVERVVSHVAKDGQRGVCIYVAPDAEAVRRSQTLAQVPADRVWPARIMGRTGRPDSRG